MFKSIFSNLSYDNFQTTLDNETYIIYYTCSQMNDDTYCLTLSLDSIAPSKCAKVLAHINQTFQKGFHRKDYFIILSYDSVFEYYCEKLAPRFGKFERLMRKFLSITFTKSLGAKWPKNVFSKEQQDKLKSNFNINNTGQLIERAFYEMTFSQLYDFLFKEFSIVLPEHVIYDQLLTLDLENTDKSVIIKKQLYGKSFSAQTRSIYRII